MIPISNNSNNVKTTCFTTFSDGAEMALLFITDSCVFLQLGSQVELAPPLVILHQTPLILSQGLLPPILRLDQIWLPVNDEEMTVCMTIQK